MKISRRRLITVSAAAAVAPCSALAESTSVRWTGTAMGASASLTMTGIPKQQANALISAARAEIDRLENQFSLYRKHSTLSQLNQNRIVTAPPFEFLELLTLANHIHTLTKGAFDPTVQALWSLYASARGRPTQSQISEVLSQTGWEYLDWDAQKVSFKKPETQLTFNGIAQGYITDRLARLLRQNGLKNVLVSMGEVSAIGQRSPSKPWRVGLAETGDGQIEETFALKNAAIATSAPLGTQFDEHGEIGHIINPKTGKPGSTWRRISVVHRSAAIADALSTAFAILGKEKIVAILEMVNGAKVIGVDLEGIRFESSG